MGDGGVPHQRKNEEFQKQYRKKKEIFIYICMKSVLKLVMLAEMRMRVADMKKKNLSTIIYRLE